MRRATVRQPFGFFMLIAAIIIGAGLLIVIQDVGTPLLDFADTQADTATSTTAVGWWRDWLNALATIITVLAGGGFIIWAQRRSAAR